MGNMKYGFINTSVFNKGIKRVNKDRNFVEIKDNLQNATKRSKELLYNIRKTITKRNILY